MVSAQIAGTYKIYIEAPSGSRRLVSSANAYWWGPGGSSDAAIANTPEKWNTLPLSADIGGPGYRIVFTVTAGAAATMDASDGAMVVPVFVNGTQQNVGNDDHASGVGNDNFTVDYSPGDNALVAATETPYQILRAKEGVHFRVGGGRVFWSIENNA